jgi:hypothetical protein
LAMFNYSYNYLNRTIISYSIFKKLHRAQNMLSAKNDFLHKIPDAKPVRIFLPMKDNHARHSVHGVYHNSVIPFFDLHFDQGVLPVNSINCKKTCILSINIDGSTTFFEAKISKIKDLQNLVLTALRQVSPEQMREFFRVEVITSVIGESMQPQLIGDICDDLIIAGQTIDISASGIFASFPKKPPAEQQIRLKITLPTQENEIISVIAHPVRIVKISEKQYDAAFHFDKISAVDRDKIIECCLVIQRRLLRLKIKVKDL